MNSSSCGVPHLNFNLSCDCGLKHCWEPTTVTPWLIPGEQVAELVCLTSYDLVVTALYTMAKSYGVALDHVKGCSVSSSDEIEHWTHTLFTLKFWAHPRIRACVTWPFLCGLGLVLLILCFDDFSGRNSSSCGIPHLNFNLSCDCGLKHCWERTTVTRG